MTIFKQLLALSVALSFTINASAQKSYTDSIAAFRNNYKEDFIKEERSPLKGKDTSYLRFYPAKKEYRIIADVQLTPQSEVFEMLTHSGKKQIHKQYALVTFMLKGKTYKLSLYQNTNMAMSAEMKNYLFLPFNDLTNYETTYAGGRYIDLKTEDVQNGKLTIDFNKAYNPYCAFKEGYSCPIPPAENRLQVRIEAGEKLFGKKTMN